MANKIENAIRNTANNKLSGKYNLAQYKEGGSRYAEKQRAMLHKQVCEEIVAFADSHKKIPFYFILSVGVSKGAYKENLTKVINVSMPKRWRLFIKWVWLTMPIMELVTRK